MIKTQRLKIWTLVTHALIMIGAGHGVGFLFIFELTFLSELSINSFSFNPHSESSNLPAVAFTTLLGQLLMLYSLAERSLKVRIIAQSAAMVMLWLGFAYLIVQAKNDKGMIISWISIFPFVVCTTIMFLGPSIKKLYRWAID